MLLYFHFSSHDGAGQQCCYDLAGYLMMTSDNKWGGNPLRNHNLGNIIIILINKKVIIITALHYGHSEESELFKSKKFVYNDTNYNINIQKIHNLISQINHEVYDIISNKDIDRWLSNEAYN